MEKVARVWVGGVNPPAPFLTVANERVNFLMIESIEKFRELYAPGDKIIISDIDSLAIKVLDFVKDSKVSAFLIRNEPHVVCPRNYKPKLVAKFRGVIDVGRKLPETTLTVPYAIRWPDEQALAQNLSKAKQRAIVFMNSNKMSFVRGELYSLRREALKSMDVAVFGPNWASSPVSRVKTLVGEFLIYVRSGQKFASRALRHWFARYDNYHGLAVDKSSVLSNFKVALTIENSADYMSEKLMEAILSGCIPVYVGPEPSTFEIPNELVVRSEPDLDAVVAATSKALEIDYSSWRLLAEKFLSRDESKTYWSERHIYNRVLAEVISA